MVDLVLHTTIYLCVSKNADEWIIFNEDCCLLLSHLSLKIWFRERFEQFLWSSKSALSRAV